MTSPDRETQGEERHEEDRFPIIGIVGPIASGKETVAQILKDLLQPKVLNPHTQEIFFGILVSS